MPTNQDILARRDAAVPRGVAQATTIQAARAMNAELWDVEGRRYIDFAGGIAVLNTGHRHPRIMEAVATQLEAFTHTAFQVVGYEPYIDLAERLNGLAPFEGPAKTILFTTGAEAVENAVKIARVATRRSGIIAFSGGFHGRTLMTSALTGKVAPYKLGVGPLPGEVYHLPFPIPHLGVTVADALAALDRLFYADIEPERVAAIIIEPVQGEGGFHIADDLLLRALRDVCDRHGVLLIADEIQSGFGRTGKMFAIEHSGVQPDLVTVAKSLAGGFPLSGVIGRSQVMDAVEPGGLGGTYAGSPVACAAALAVLDVIRDEGLLERATTMGQRCAAWLDAQTRRNDVIPIGAIRIRGAMTAFEVFAEQGRPDRPDPAGAKALAARALKAGLILLTCGRHGNVVRLLAPLTISDELLDEGLDILGEALTVERRA